MNFIKASKTMFCVLPLAVGVLGCSSLGPKRDEQSLSQIQKIGLLFFSAEIPTGNKQPTPEHAAEVDAALELTQKEVFQKKSWSYLPYVEAQKHPAYQRAFSATMKGWQNKMPTPESIQDYTVRGLMDFDSARILGFEGREALMKELGVDAIAAAKVNLNFSGFRVFGFGPRYPRSSLLITVYKKGVENPVWFEQAIGEALPNSLGTTVFMDPNKVRKSLVTALPSAINKLK